MQQSIGQSRREAALRAIDCIGNIDAAIDAYELVECMGSAEFDAVVARVRSAWCVGGVHGWLFEELIDACMAG